MLQKQILVIFTCCLISISASQYTIPLERQKPLQAEDRFNENQILLENTIKSLGYIPFKYGEIPLDSLPQKGLEAIPLVNSLNTQFYGQAKFGTPGQPINVLFDTGSANLFVLAPSCIGYPCRNRTFFNYMESRSFYLNGTKISIDFGDGDLNGFIGNDEVVIGNLKTKEVNFALIDNPFSINFIYSKPDGIIGLAYQNLTSQNLSNFFQLMINQGVVKDPSFSFYLTKEAGQRGSALVLGGIDPVYAASKFHYVKLTHESYFMTEIDNLKIGNQSFLTGKMKMIVDTGTSVLVGPLAIVKKINQLVPAEINCKRLDELVDLHLVIGGVDYVIPPSVYVIQNFGHCLLGIVGANMAGPLSNTWILGDLFMREYYTHFDYGNKRIGFARAANVTSPEIQERIVE